MITTQQLQEIMPESLAVDRDQLIGPLNAAMQEFKINNPSRKAAFLAQIAHESASLSKIESCLVGKDSYEECSAGIGVDLVANPDFLKDSIQACRSAAWYWNKHGCNELSDVGMFGATTKRISGGYTATKERLVFYAAAKKALKS